MAKKTKVWLMLAIFFIFAGGTLFTGVMMALDWDFSKLTTVEFETNEYTVAQEYKNISIRTITADVEIYPSEDGNTSVVCYEPERLKHKVEVVDGTLYINAIDTRSWYEHIGIHFKKTVVKLYIPQGVYGELVIENVTGDVDIHEGFLFNSIDASLTTGDIACAASAVGTIKLKTTTGDIKMENLKANTAELRMSTGDIRLLNVLLSWNLTITGTTGDVRIDNSDAEDISIKLTTGDIFGKFLTPKNVHASSTTGRMDLPSYIPDAAPCKIQTTTGDIIIEFNND